MNATTRQETAAVSHMSALDALMHTMAERLNMGNGIGLEKVLKQTAFKAPKVNGQFVEVTDAQLCALLVVANQYGLNPWTKEIYAFPDKNNGIVPVVGVDGWSRIINGNPMFDGIDFAQDADQCTCTIYRKDRAHHTRVTEWMVECRRIGVGPWDSHPYRMLRHKATIQCARLAFGFVGIYEQDEAERIIEADEGRIAAVQSAMATDVKPRRASEVQAALPAPEAPVVLEPVIAAATPAPAAPEPAAVAQVPVAPAQAAAPAAPAPAPLAVDEPLASAGECMNVIVTARTKKRDLGAMLAEHGFEHLDPATLSGLTKAGFKALKGAM